jgi:HPt (histidine-containing phosphotransfer) domain-containing protein
MATPVLDENTLKQFSPTQLTTYFAVYLKNAKQLVEGIQKDMEMKNFDIMKARAHKLKGSSMTVGASTVRESAHDIENNIKTSLPVEQAHIDKLKECFIELTQVLKEKYNIAA